MCWPLPASGERRDGAHRRQRGGDAGLVGALAAERTQRRHLGVAGPAVEPGPAAGAEGREVVGLPVAVRAVFAEGRDGRGDEAVLAGSGGARRQSPSDSASAGGKSWMIASASLSRLSRTWRPLSVVMSRVTPCLLQLSRGTCRSSQGAVRRRGRGRARGRDRRSGGSTLMTSAPRSAISFVA